jgi:hypothetical protein
MTHIIEDTDTRESTCGAIAEVGQSGPLCSECNMLV